MIKKFFQENYWALWKSFTFLMSRIQYKKKSLTLKFKVGSWRVFPSSRTSRIHPWQVFSFHRLYVTFALFVEISFRAKQWQNGLSPNPLYRSLYVFIADCSIFGRCWVNRVSVERSWKNGVTCVLVGRGNRISTQPAKAARRNGEN